MKQYRYYDFVMAAFVTVLLCSNFIGAAKQTTIDLPLLGATTFSPGTLTSHDSRLSECWAAAPVPEPAGRRRTIGTLALPPNM